MPRRRRVTRRISYGNTIKKQRDIQYAYDKGVRLFAFDCDAELDKIIEVAPDATVFCRITTDGGGADWPLSRKFGTTPMLATDLLLVAADKGMAVGVSFHVGSQQRNVTAWDKALAPVDVIFARLRDEGVTPALVNLGGGFPGHYIDGVPAVDTYGEAIIAALHRHLGHDLPRIIAEPGRYLVADAGVMESRSRVWCRAVRSKTTCVGFTSTPASTTGWPKRRANPFATASRPNMTVARPVGWRLPDRPAIPLTSSTRRTHYELPLALTAGDRLRIKSTGAYTTTYASVAFNGFAPIRDYYLPG